MEISPLFQAKLLLYTVLLGIFTAALYDVLWLLCNAFEKKRWLRATLNFIRDTTVFSVAAAGTVLLSF